MVKNRLNKRDSVYVVLCRGSVVVLFPSRSRTEYLSSHSFSSKVSALMHHSGVWGVGLIG